MPAAVKNEIPDFSGTLKAESFTRGPWAAQVERGLFVYAVDENAPTVCIVSDTEQGEANARLIAAAPDLYEALKMMLDRFNGEEMITPLELAKAVAALAKARSK